MAQAPSNSFHYMGIGKETTPGTPVAPTVLIKYNEYSGNAQIENDEDKGHMGARGLGGTIDRTKAFAEPEIKDRLRPDGPLENIFMSFFGSKTSTAQTSPTAIKHTFALADTLPTYTITHGFNFDAEAARTFAECICNSLEFSFSTEEAPSISAKYVSNFPEFGASEPTLTFPTTKPFKAGQLTAYWGAVGSTPTDLIPGYKEGSLTFNNNIENGMEMGLDFGQVAKDMGDLTVEGNLTVKYVDTDYQREWATGSTSGLAAIEEGLQKALRFKYTGPLIADTFYYYVLVDVLNAEITNVNPSEGGEGAKTFEIEFQGMLNDSGLKVSGEIMSKLAGASF